MGKMNYSRKPDQGNHDDYPENKRLRFSSLPGRCCSWNNFCIKGKEKKNHTSTVQFFRTHKGKYQGWTWLVPQLYTMKTEQRNRSQAHSLLPLLPPLLRKVSTSATHNFPFLLFLQLPISPRRQIVCNGIKQKPDEILKASPFCVPRVLPKRESLVKKWILTSLFCSVLVQVTLLR